LILVITWVSCILLAITCNFRGAKFEVLTAVLMKIQAFRDGTPCQLVQQHNIPEDLNLQFWMSLGAQLRREFHGTWHKLGQAMLKCPDFQYIMTLDSSRQEQQLRKDIYMQ
jgi:hypothetical protein